MIVCNLCGQTHSSTGCPPEAKLLVGSTGMEAAEFEIKRLKDALEAKQVRIADLEDHTKGLEGLIDYIIENCPEVRRTITAYILAHLKESRK